MDSVESSLVLLGPPTPLRFVHMCAAIPRIKTEFYMIKFQKNFRCYKNQKQMFWSDTMMVTVERNNSFPVLIT